MKHILHQALRTMYIYHSYNNILYDSTMHTPWQIAWYTRDRGLWPDVHVYISAICFLYQFQEHPKNASEMHWHSLQSTVTHSESLTYTHPVDSRCMRGNYRPLGFYIHKGRDLWRHCTSGIIPIHSQPLYINPDVERAAKSNICTASAC